MSVSAESARISSTRRMERSAALAVTVPVGFSMLVGAQGPCHLNMAMNAHLVTLRVTDVFPASASIKLETGKQIIVSELQVGDKVQTGIYWNHNLPSLSIKIGV